MSRRRWTDDFTEALRRADPLDPREAPKDTTGAHARSLFLEVTSMETTSPQKTPPARRPLWHKLTLAAGTAVVVAAATVGAYLLIGDGAEEVIVGGEPIGGDPMAICLQYTDETLAAQEIAFDGTLISATPDGGEAVFEVHHWFKGGEGDRVTLSAEGLMVESSIALVGATLEVGGRYLVSGSDGFVWACGYTLTYDTALADHWAEVFGA